ncbi:MAG: LPS-assembly protein LptD [Deltaproteobacteria bacterium]|nr:LPS-assembly protein LptD [Deltaproteobacteria bacterium]
MARLIVIFATIVVLIIPRMLIAMTYDVEAERIEKIGETVEAEGNVIITGTEVELRANYVVYNTQTGDIWASGECFLHEENGEINASVLYYNTERRDAYLELGSVFIFDEPMRITGDSIVRYGDDYYIGDRITYTPCLGLPPAWSIQAKHLEIPIEGYGKATHARFNLSNMPVLYIPYLLYPAKLKRQSGLLFPDIGNSTDTGYILGLPIYFVLGRSADFTLKPSYLSRRGLLLSTQFRYQWDVDTMGEIYLEGLHDKQGGENLEGGVLDKIPDDRWLIKAFHKGTKLSYDINLISHEDYFRDIGTFYDESGQDVWAAQRPDDIEELISRLEWHTSGRGFNCNISSQWKQDLTIKDDDETFQILPKLTVRKSLDDIPFTPFRYTAQVSSTRVYSEKWIEAVKDQGDIDISWPIVLYPYLTLRPYVNEIYRDTYITQDRQLYDENTFREHWQERGASIATSLYSRRLESGYYHQIVPGVTWSYLSRYNGNYDENDPYDIYPELLSGEDWEKEFNLELSLENFIRNDRDQSVVDFSLIRVFSYLTKEWDDFEAKVRIRPIKWFYLEHRNTFGRDPLRAYATQEHTTEFNLSDPRGDNLSVVEEYERGYTNSLCLKSIVNLARGFAVKLEGKYDYIDRRYEYYQQSVTYSAQCWQIELIHEVEPSDDDNPRDTTIYLRVNLLGLGDVIQTKYGMVN